MCNSEIEELMLNTVFNHSPGLCPTVGINPNTPRITPIHPNQALNPAPSPFKPAYKPNAAPIKCTMLCVRLTPKIPRIEFVNNPQIPTIANTIPKTREAIANSEVLSFAI